MKALLVLRWALCLTWLLSSVAAAGDNDSTPRATPGAWTWEFQLERVTEKTSPFMDKATRQTKNVTLILDDRGYVLIEPEQTRIYDALKRRLFTVNRIEKQYLETPIHAIVWFRSKEMIHRHGLCHAFEAGELNFAEMEPCSRFELETLFSISVRDDSKLFEEHLPQIKTIQTDDAWHFQHEGQEYVTFKPSAHNLSSVYQDRFRQFLAHQCDVHPEIRRQLVKFGNFPERLTYLSREGSTVTKVSYSLKNSAFAEKPSIVDIPQDFVPSAEDSRMEQLLEKLAHTKIPSPTELQKDAEDAIERAMASADKVEAVLAAQRYFVVTDDSVGHRKLLERCGGIGDKEVRRMVYDFGSFRKMEYTKRTLIAENRSRFNYLLDYYIADLAMTEHRQDIKVQELLFDALQSDVLIVGAFVDLARVFMQEWDYHKAWQCIEAAKRISPHHSNLAPIQDMEKKLELDFPEFF